MHYTYYIHSGKLICLCRFFFVEKVELNIYLMIYINENKTINPMKINTHFSEQYLPDQIVLSRDKEKLNKLSNQHGGDIYVKTFITNNQVVVMLFDAFESDHSFREMVFWLLVNTDKLVHSALSYIDIPDDAEFNVLKDEVITLYEGKKINEQKARYITYWDRENSRIFEIVTNSFKLTAEQIETIYGRVVNRAFV